MTLDRSPELELLELAVKESKRLGVPFDELKGLIKLTDAGEATAIPLKRDPDPREHPLEEVVRELAAAVGLTLVQLEEVTHLERTMPYIPKDIAFIEDDPYSLEHAQRLGISLDLYYLLGRGSKVEDIEDDELFIPHRR
jgi:phytoene/squalene synthetase